jgi:hypothetical protein
MINGANNSVVGEGAALMVNVANGPGNRTDWVGLAVAGTPDGAFMAWAYLNGTQTPPAVGVTSATVMMTAPTSDGPYEARFYPNNARTVSARASFAVVGVTSPPAPPPPPPTAAVPVIVVTPISPQIPDTTPKGAIVATFRVTMSDGSSSFLGTVALTNDGGGVFALSPLTRNPDGSATGQILVSPSGPGVGPNSGTITDHITLVAAQP